MTRKMPGQETAGHAVARACADELELPIKEMGVLLSFAPHLLTGDHDVIPELQDHSGSAGTARDKRRMNAVDLAGVERSVIRRRHKGAPAHSRIPRPHCSTHW
jgi:hypothetical protein